MANTEVAFAASFSLNPVSSLSPKGIDLVEVTGWLCSIQCTVFAPCKMQRLMKREMLVPKRRSAPKNTIEKRNYFQNSPIIGEFRGLNHSWSNAGRLMGWHRAARLLRSAVLIPCFVCLIG